MHAQPVSPEPDRSGSPSQEVSVRVFLKQATTEAHDALDRKTSKVFKRGEDPEVAKQSYSNLMVAHYGIVCAIEDAVHRSDAGRALFVDSPLSLQEMEKTHLLVEDLISLGLSVEDIHAIKKPEVPTPQSTAYAAGILYVLEGSSIGGPVVAAMVQRATGLPPENFRFLKAYGDFPDARERFNNTFAPALEALVPDDAARQEAVRGANETFAAFSSWFEKAGVIPGNDAETK